MRIRTAIKICMLNRWSFKKVWFQIIDSVFNLRFFLIFISVKIFGFKNLTHIFLRWNCSLINPNTKEVFGDMILNRGTREAAFVHAISSAGIAYRITRFVIQLITRSVPLVDLNADGRIVGTVPRDWSINVAVTWVLWRKRISSTGTDARIMSDTVSLCQGPSLMLLRGAKTKRLDEKLWICIIITLGDRWRH